MRMAMAAARMVAVAFAVVSTPFFKLSPCVAAAAHLSRFTCSSWESLFAAAGDVEPETAAEAAMPKRFLTVSELNTLRTSYATGPHRLPLAERQAFTPRECNVHRSLQMTEANAKHLAETPLLASQVVAPAGTLPGLRDRIRGRWIYMYGDSTLRQQAGFLLRHLSTSDTAGTHPLSFAKLKECTRGALGEDLCGASCNSVQNTDAWEHSYPGPRLNLNERTTTWQFADDNVTLTFDWKSTAFRKWDRWLLSKRFGQGLGADVPDQIIMEFGVHDCYYAGSQGKNVDPVNGDGDAYHRATTKAMLAYYAANLPPTTQLVILSPQHLAVDNYKHEWYPSCAKAITETLAEEAAAGGWFTFVDRLELTERCTLAGSGKPGTSFSTLFRRPNTTWADLVTPGASMCKMVSSTCVADAGCPMRDECAGVRVVCVCVCVCVCLGGGMALCASPSIWRARSSGVCWEISREFQDSTSTLVCLSVAIPTACFCLTCQVTRCTLQNPSLAPSPNSSGLPPRVLRHEAKATANHTARTAVLMHLLHTFRLAQGPNTRSISRQAKPAPMHHVLPVWPLFS